jgi:spore coat polysaccharide biosynthesis predicted glycosyltransferase SpsG
MDSVLLICYVNSEIGLGHLSRLLAVAESLRNEKYLAPEFLIFGDYIEKKELLKFKVHNVPITDTFSIKVKNILKFNSYKAIIFDLYPAHNIVNFDKLCKEIKRNKILLISIDSLFEYSDILDFIWVPSTNFNDKKYQKISKKIKTGWDSLLIQKRLAQKEWVPGKNLLVLTGGSDFYQLGNTLPTQLDSSLDNDVQVHWVKGPFSNYPVMPKECRLNWNIHNNPEYLDDLIVQSNYVMTVFGVSFFEVLQYGIPTVVFSPNMSKDSMDLVAIEKEGVALVSKNIQIAIRDIIELMNNNELSEIYSSQALKKMSINGAQNFSKEIYNLLGFN